MRGKKSEPSKYLNVHTCLMFVTHAEMLMYENMCTIHKYLSKYYSYIVIIRVKMIVIRIVEHLIIYDY